MLSNEGHCDPPIAEKQSRALYWIVSSYAFGILLAMTCTVHADEWQQIANGLQYKKFLVNQELPSEKGAVPGKIHAFQIDSLKYKLDIVTAKELGMQAATAKTFAEKSGALIAVNGGFFTPEYAPLGVLVRNHVEINKLKPISWWYIFIMRREKPQIITKREYQMLSAKWMGEIDMAIESGPRLLIDGSMPKLKLGTAAERSAIGIGIDGKIIIVVTDGAPMTLTEFAQNLKIIGCYDALNLDGGSSSQIYAKLGHFKLNREGLGFVANAVVVKTR